MNTDIGLNFNTDSTIDIGIETDTKKKLEVDTKVLVCDKISSESIEKMRSSGLTLDIKLGLSESELMGIVSEYDALIVRSSTKVTSSVINASSRLKLIVRGGVGVDNIDIGSAEKKNITVMNTPDASTNSVAELSLALILSLSRFIPQADSSMKKMLWEKKNLMGTEIKGKTLGILGAGRIGFCLASKALALGMNVIAVDHPEANPSFREAGIKMMSLKEVLQESDYVSIHVPFKKGTTPIIGRKELSYMKPSACILNMARGGAIDESALLEALNDNKISGAALDVWYDEPSSNEELITHKRVIALPHLGASTKEGQARVSSSVAKKTIDFFSKLN